MIRRRWTCAGAMKLTRSNVALGQQIIMWTRGNACPGVVHCTGFMWTGPQCTYFKVLKMILFPVRSLKTLTLAFSKIFLVTPIFCQYFDNRYYEMHNTKVWGSFWCKRLKTQNLSLKETYITHSVTNSYCFFPPCCYTWSSLPFLKSPCQVE